MSLNLVTWPNVASKENHNSLCSRYLITPNKIKILLLRKKVRSHAEGGSFPYWPHLVIVTGSRISVIKNIPFALSFCLSKSLLNANILIGK